MKELKSICLLCDNKDNCSMHRKEPEKRVVECGRYENEDMKEICSLIQSKWKNGRVERYW